MQVTMTVNGDEVTAEVEPRLLLVHFLRDELGLTGTHWGCDTSNCGACVVGWTACRSRAAPCWRPWPTARGPHRRGPGAGRRARPGAAGLHARGTACSAASARPGMMMTARWLLDHNPDPTEAEIREAISGNSAAAPATRTSCGPVRWAAEHPPPAAGGGAGMTTTDADRLSAGRQPDRLRPHAAQGGRAVPARPGQLRRRHPAARHAARRGPAQPVRPRPDRLDRHVAAEAHPKVKAVITGAVLETLDLAWMPTLSDDVQSVLATDKVRFQGQEVAFVVAEDRYSARDALELIDVEYEPLPPVDRRPQGARRRRAGHPRRHRGQDRQPHLRLGGRRRGRVRRGLRRRRGRRRRRTCSTPACTRRRWRPAGRSRRHGQGHRQAHDLDHDARRRTPTARSTRSSPACPSTRSR